MYKNNNLMHQNVLNLSEIVLSKKKISMKNYENVTPITHLNEPYEEYICK